MAVCFIDRIENIVKDDKKDTWPEAKTRWFVQDHTDARDLRRPGKMKEEWSTSNGSIVW